MLPVCRVTALRLVAAALTGLEGMVARYVGDDAMTTSSIYTTRWYDTEQALQLSGYSSTTYYPKPRQAPSGSRSLYFDGQDAMSFAGSTYNFGFPRGSEPRTLVAMVRYRTSGGQWTASYGQYTTSASFTLGTYTGGTGPNGWVYTSQAAPSPPLSASQWVDRWMVQVVLYDPSAPVSSRFRVYMDGEPTYIGNAPTTVNTNALFTSTNLVVGTHQSFSSYWLNGELASLLVFNRALDEASLNAVTSSLQSKYLSPGM